ncbi:MAG TPA: translation initiation factor IF-2, partial [Puia sp.]
MAETTTPRLMAAAKEFNIGRDTLIDFLAGKGFNKEDLKPTAKLTEEMYHSLQQEFQGDKVAKIKSNQIDLPKGSVEAKRKKEDEAVLFRKDPKKASREEPVAPVVEEPKVVKAEEPKKPKAEEPKKEPEITKIEAPDIEGPKIIDKIDLSSIDSSTRPKKTSKKKTETAAQKEEPVVAEDKVGETEPGVPAETEKAEEANTIENIRAEKIEGPRILGKIELPVEADKPKQLDEKRKRKRIPIEKRDTGRPATSPGTPVQRESRPGGAGRPILRRDQRGPAGGNRGNTTPREQKEIDKKEIQEKIRETQAKLAGTGGRGKSLKAKYRRARREENA